MKKKKLFQAREEEPFFSQRASIATEDDSDMRIDL